MATQPQKYLVATKGEPLAIGINHIAPNPKKGTSKKRREKRLKSAISPDKRHEMQVKWEHGESERRKIISSYIDQKNWPKLEEYLENFEVKYKYWLLPTMNFTQEKLSSIEECPNTIHGILAKVLDKKRQKEKISSYIDCKNWAGVEKYLKYLFQLKYTWANSVMLFAQEKLQNAPECPSTILEMVDRMLTKQKKS